MKIDLSQEQGTLVPLYFYRRPLGWPNQVCEKKSTSCSPLTPSDGALLAFSPLRA